MTQQAVRRVRRGKGQTGGAMALLRGVLAAVAATVIVVCLFAVLIGLTDLDDRVIRIVNQLIKAGAIVLGVCAAVPRGDAAGPRRGMAVGLIYMGVGVLLYALLTSQKITALAYGIDLLMGVAAGGLTGMTRAGRIGSR